MRQEILSQKTFIGLVLMAHAVIFFAKARDSRIDSAIPIKLTFTKIGGGSGNLAKIPEPVKKLQEKVIAKKAKERKNIFAEKFIRTEKKEEAPVADTSGLAGATAGSGPGIGNGMGEGVGSADPLKIYGSRVAELLNKNKVYPAMARRMDHQGRVLLKITVDRSGKLLDIKMLKESPFVTLNDAALEMVKKVEQFPPLPNELTHDVVTFNVPVEYKLH